MAQHPCRQDDPAQPALSHPDPSQDFVELWKLHQDDLHALCLNLMGSRSEAEEAFGNASIIALVKFKQVSGELQCPKAWLTKLFRNACMDLHRKRKRQRELGVASLEELEETPIWPAATALKSPQQSYLERELDDFVRRSVRALPERLRRPMVLRFFKQLSYQEIGSRLRISEENARKRVQQARALLRQRIAAYFEGRPELVENVIAADDDEAIVAREEVLSPPELGEDGGTALDSRALALRAVTVRLPSGALNDFLLFLPKRERHNPEARLASLIRYAAKHPGGWKKRQEIADVLYLAGRWEEALAEYRFVLERQPFLLEVWVRAGEILQGLRRDQEAVEAYQRALLLARSAGSRHHLRGRIDLCRRQLDAAIDNLEQAAASEPSNRAHWHLLGALQMAADRPLESLAAFDQALEIDAEDLQALTQGHQALLALGRWREVRRRAQRALETAPANFVAAQQLADLRCRRRLIAGDEGRATRRLIQSVLRLAPHWPEGHGSLAHYHLARGRADEAEAVLARFVAEHRDHARGWTLFARHLHAAGRTAAAADAILQALSLDERDLRIYLQACAILSDDMPEQARRVCAEAIERFPESWSAWVAAGLHHAERGELRRACLLAWQAVQLQPHLALAWLGYGTVLLRCEVFKPASSALERAWAHMPLGDGPAEAAPTAYRLAESYRHLGDEDRAAGWYRRAAAAAADLLDLDVPLGHFWRARALARLGDVEGARRDHQAALDNHLPEPERTVAGEALATAGAALVR